MDKTLPTGRCPKCGGMIPAESAHGLCPKCLLAGASTPTDPGIERSGTGASPGLDEIAAAFPELEVLDVLGQGGMGIVFKARQPRLDRLVALKILLPHLGATPDFAERFLREARMLARLNHPNIVTVHDFGESGGFYYLLMEYVDGVNLRQAMRTGRFAPEQALAVVPKICEALQYAHDEGVLHRDIKPENILIDTRGRVKIADFGIAKLIGSEAAEFTLTQSGARLGTPTYMAPEQIENRGDVDHRADIYSLGVVFYEMLTGELPIGRFAPPSSKSAVDARIDEIVFRTLEKEREQRFQSAGEVKTRVETVAAHPQPPVPSRRPIPASANIRKVEPEGRLGRGARGAESAGVRRSCTASRSAVGKSSRRTGRTRQDGWSWHHAACSGRVLPGRDGAGGNDSRLDGDAGCPRIARDAPWRRAFSIRGGDVAALDRRLGLCAGGGVGRARIPERGPSPPECADMDRRSCDGRCAIPCDHLGAKGLAMDDGAGCDGRGGTTASPPWSGMALAARSGVHPAGAVRRAAAPVFRGPNVLAANHATHRPRGRRRRPRR